jgi:hypothetical protein
MKSWQRYKGCIWTTEQASTSSVMATSLFYTKTTWAPTGYQTCPGLSCHKPEPGVECWLPNSHYLLSLVLACCSTCIIRKAKTGPEWQPRGYRAWCVILTAWVWSPESIQTWKERTKSTKLFFDLCVHTLAWCVHIHIHNKYLEKKNKTSLEAKERAQWENLLRMWVSVFGWIARTRVKPDAAVLVWSHHTPTCRWGAETDRPRELQASLMCATANN